MGCWDLKAEVIPTQTLFLETEIFNLGDMAKLDPIKFKLKNGSEVVIRSYEPADAQALLEFTKKAARDSTQTLKYVGMPLASSERLSENLQDFMDHPINMCIGVFSNSTIVGNLRFFQRNGDHPWTKHIAAFGMAVSQEMWGQGLGSKMLHLMESHARNNGIIRIEAEVRTANDRGIELYKKNGFEIEGTRKAAAFIEGQFKDEYYIGKILKSL